LEVLLEGRQLIDWRTFFQNIFHTMFIR
jgi:hypothetical protein